MTLTEIANKYGTDKGTIKKYDWEGDRHFYTPIYETYLDTLKNDHLNILEIGIGSGPSLRMWYEYLPNSNIFAIDIDDKTMYNNDRVKCYKGDQSNRNDLDRIANDIISRTGSLFDVIIDDGGHYMKQQQTSLGALFKYVKSGGLYFIEDLHTSHWPHGKVIYNNVPVDINDDRSNTTDKMINDFIKNKKINSIYLTDDEISYLNDTIESCDKHHTIENVYGPNDIAVFKKGI